jgi:hypothetical protein
MAPERPSEAPAFLPDGASLAEGVTWRLTATTREWSLLLLLPQAAFERLFNGEESGSHVFLGVIHFDPMAALRQVLRPRARLAASV